jgi:uncharacterized membrane-anchored protein
MFLTVSSLGEDETMTQQNRHRCAAVLAFILGLLSIKEGGSVLLGLSTKAYTILPWLVWYNVVLGFVSVIAGIGMWMQRRWGVTFAATIVSLHGLVFVILIILFAFREAVALNSIMAMLFRTVVWVGIMMLMSWRSRGQTGNA